VEKYCRAVQVTDDNMAHAHCILDPKDYKYTHSGCVTFFAFPQQQSLHEHVSMLRYTYIACLVLRLFTAIITFTQCTTSYKLPARSLFSLLYDYPCTRMTYLLENRREPNAISPLDINTVLPSMLHVSCTYMHRALFHTFRL